MIAVHFLGHDRISIDEVPRPEPRDQDVDDLIRQELTIYGSRSFVLSEFSEMIALVRRGLPVERIVTHRYPLSDAEVVFALFRSAECGKIVFTA